MIPFIDLQTQYAAIAKNVEPDIIACLRNCQYIGGHYVERFERSLCNYLHANHVVGVSSGTDAIMLSCESLNICEGDYVLIPNNACIDSAFGITRAGATPIFVDVDPNTYLMDMEKAEELLKTHPKRKRIRAILVVDLYGQQPNMEEFQEMSKRHKVYLIEDASHAIGSTHRGKHISYYSDISVASFQPEYNLGTIGQGAAIITHDPILAKKIRIIINQGSEREFQHICIGGTYRLNAVMATQLYHALHKLEEWNDRRRLIARIYNDKFNSEQRPTQQPCGRHVYQFYKFKCASTAERNNLEKVFLQNSIGHGFHYPSLISDTPMYANLGMLETPVAYDLRNRLISLPMHPFLSLDQALEVVEWVQSVTG